MSAQARASATSLAFGWSLERRDGAGVALTSHDRTIAAEDTTYVAAPGLMPNAVQAGSLDEPLAELTCALNGSVLSSGDLQSGRWDGARATLALLDWNAAASFAILCEGELGEVTHQGESFSVDFRGAGRFLERPACPGTSPTCRAALGDKDCRIDLAGRELRTRVISVTGSSVELEAEAGDSFVLGTLRWLSGANCGLKDQVVSREGRAIRLRQTPPFEVKQGDAVLLREGCDKRLQTCRDRFGNVANFRGEPHLPGGDFLTRYPGA